MIAIRNFTITGIDETVKHYVAEIKKESEKLHVTLKNSAGGMKEIFEVFNDNNEIVVKTYTVSIILKPETELYKKLQQLGVEYL
ncbi:hypothetical protein FAZ19_19720 [Sphingobacterium alkalisoli]|uniref:Uncharacterized protein n=1 Tax=Sphingobacterium alkalisoli TaxID=1874115 RepID=A0A4V5LXL4_9SPHI|nr:hypothetical protein [Sphingobacterium alkalisoli]TJY62699.1 hypothetical protein FAZ19_19720 [Sphingobacterium alkalisoli]GGH28297.1 hypothetical protein GCM10011418_38850 [Sphingobacterium alkalisoli]